MGELVQSDGSSEVVTITSGASASSGCCDRGVLEIPLVLLGRGGLASAIPFLERTGQRPMVPAIRPRIEPYAHRTHSIPLVPPLPLADFFVDSDGPCPDRGQTLEWPYPSDSAE